MRTVNSWSTNSTELNLFSTGMVEASKKAETPGKKNDQKLQLGYVEIWKEDNGPLAVVLWKWWQEHLALCA